MINFIFFLVFQSNIDNSGAGFDVEKYFSDLLNKDHNLSAGIAAIKTLLMVLEKTKCKSIHQRGPSLVSNFITFVSYCS